MKNRSKTTGPAVVAGLVLALTACGDPAPAESTSSNSTGAVKEKLEEQGKPKAK